METTSDALVLGSLSLGRSRRLSPPMWSSFFITLLVSTPLPSSVTSSICAAILNVFFYISVFLNSILFPPLKDAALLPFLELD